MGRPLRSVSWGLLALTIVGVLGLFVTRWTETRERLPVIGAIAPFRLQDSTGLPVTEANLQGHISIVEFFFARCPSQCPLMNKNLATLLKILPAEWPVQALSISIDPEHDTPALLSDYQRRLGYSRRWRFCTGDRLAIYALSRQSFHLAVDPSADPSVGIEHSSRWIVVDQSGRIRGYFDGTDAASIPILRKAIRSLMREG